MFLVRKIDKTKTDSSEDLILLLEKIFQLSIFGCDCMAPFSKILGTPLTLSLNVFTFTHCMYEGPISKST